MTKNRRKIVSFVSLLMLIAVSFNSANVTAEDEPEVNISNEVLFYDIFAVWDPTKWTCVKDPSPPNLCERSGDYPSEAQWSSWFLDTDGNLHIYSPQSSNGIALAASSGYSQSMDYVIRFQFLLTGYANSKFKVVDDGYVLLTIEQNTDLYAFDGSTYTLLETLALEQWYLIEIRVHVLSHEYDVYIGRNWKANFNFASGSKGHLILGDDSYSTNVYGEGYWDDVVVALLHAQVWSDNFDDQDIADWSVITSGDSTFRVTYTPPYSLYMSEIGALAYGFTPFYDMPGYIDYMISFQFSIPTTDSVGATVVADGNVRIILNGDWLMAYLSETNIEPITQLLLGPWYSIEIDVDSALQQYYVTVNSIKSPSPFGFVQQEAFVKSPSQMLMGDHETSSNGGEAYWDNIKARLMQPPELDWCGTPGFMNDGVDPDIGDALTKFMYCVKYTDLDNDPPNPGPPSDPMVYINKGGAPWGASPFSMIEDDPSDIDYTNGKLYKYSTTLDEGVDYTYQFTASDNLGLPAIPTPWEDAPDVYPANQPPILSNCHVSPNIGRAYLTTFTYFCTYTDADNDPPNTGYPKVYIDSGAQILTMNLDTSAYIDLRDGDYINGEQYRSDPITLAAGTHTFYFEAYDIYGGFARDPPLPPDEHNGPEVYDYDEPWWMFHHDLEHLSYSTNTAPGPDAIIKWRYQDSDPSKRYGSISSPAVRDGLVFIGGFDGYLYAFNMDLGGDPLWRYGTSGRIFSSPAVTNNLVIFGSEDGYVYCVDYFGNLEWKHPTVGRVTSSPAVHNNKVFILSPGEHSPEGYLYALDEFGNGDGTTDELWKYPINQGSWSSPAVADGMIFFYTYGDDLYSIDEDGNLVWKIHQPDGYGTEASVTVLNGKVFLETSTNGVYAFDEYTGNVIWNRKIDNYYFDGSVAIHNKRIFAEGEYIDPTNPANRYTTIFALDEDTGNTIWTHTRYPPRSLARQWGGPAVADGKVIVKMYGWVIALDEVGNPDQTTDLIWELLVEPVYNAGSESSPAVADGYVFVGTSTMTIPNSDQWLIISIHDP